MQRENKHKTGVGEIKVTGLRRRHGKGEQQQGSKKKGVEKGISSILSCAIYKERS